MAGRPALYGEAPGAHGQRGHRPGRPPLRHCLDAAETYERLGSPEGELALAQAVIYPAVAPKSNAVYTAYKAAKALVAQDRSRPVPVHLRNAPTKLMKSMGVGAAYRPTTSPTRSPQARSTCLRAWRT